jgi:hypothetical protein
MTVFIDEGDAAIYPKDRVEYFRMLETAHQRSGRYQTILITQIEEIAAMASKTLDVRTLTGRTK